MSARLTSSLARASLRTILARPSAYRSIPVQIAAPQRLLSSTSRVLKKSKAGSGSGSSGKSKASKPDDEGGINPEERERALDKTKARMDKAAEWARLVVFDNVERGRGRVTPALLDPVKVALPDSGLVPLNQVASITVKANTLFVEVWDTATIKLVETALHKANLPGLSPQRDGNAIRIPVARPSGEIRAKILKSLAETIESAKNQIRQARTDGMKALGGRGEEGTDAVQAMTDKVVAEVEGLLLSAKKEFEKV